MGAWSKLFADRNRVTTTRTIKTPDGVTYGIKPGVGAVGVSREAVAEAVRIGGATLTELGKETDEDGTEHTTRNTVKPENTTKEEAHNAVCDILRITPPAEVPEPVRRRGRSVVPVPSDNGTPADGAVKG
ncbi:MAG TPA: hypothetical protein VD866_16730 [Urbifossiella sp.]|nr:hypothetical protein [Urbifossiella sp.]